MNVIHDERKRQASSSMVKKVVGDVDQRVREGLYLVEGPRRKGVVVVVDGESESGDGEGNEVGNEQHNDPNKLIYVAK